MASSSNDGVSHLNPKNSNNKVRFAQRIKLFLFGKPRDLEDKSMFHRLSLIPVLAWIGLGADGLSSSSYGPEEAFRTLGSHTYIAIGIALITSITIVVIASAYSRIVEAFPHGGGGYVVATKLLGKYVGLISGCALLVDYVMTITVSIAAAGDTLFSFLPLHIHTLKIPFEIVLILCLTTLNVRGVRESVIALAPIFVLFLITHIILIGGGIISHIPQLPETAQTVSRDFNQGLHSLGLGAMILLFLHSYSLGGGTYTGLEAVSNGVPILRDPKVETAKKTMVYMAISLAFTASGLLICYLLWDVHFIPGKTMNAVLAEKFAGGGSIGRTFVILTLLSEGALLVVGAQAGFIDGPRVLSNMSVDSWAPRHFAALSERLTTQNGVLLMSMASLAALLYTRGNIQHLVVMYSINVFLTFSISMFGMSGMWIKLKGKNPLWKRRFAQFAFGFLLCATIFVITTIEKFREGGWLTLLVTGLLIIVCMMIRRHYQTVSKKFKDLYRQLEKIALEPQKSIPDFDPSKPTAAILVGGYTGVGIHTVLNISRIFPNYFKNYIFISVGVIDSGGFKGEGAIEELKIETEKSLNSYVELCKTLGIPAKYKYAIGTDAVAEGENLCLGMASEFPNITFFAGKVIFEREGFFHRLLHNDTAFAIQKRLQLIGRTMVIIPARIE